MKIDSEDYNAVALAFEFNKLHRDMDKLFEEYRANVTKILEDYQKEQEAIFKEAGAKIAEILNK